MASVASQLIEEDTAHAQSDSLEDARQICADGSYFPNNLRIYRHCTATKQPAIPSVCPDSHSLSIQYPVSTQRQTQSIKQPQQQLLTASAFP
jgi:hypothetical protein